jgi:hypothetical protein
MARQFLSHQALVAALTFIAGPLAWAADAPEVGLITQAGGAVQVVESGGNPAPAVSFAKLKTGAKVIVGAEAKFQVVYLNSGRQETWAGAAELEVGDTASKPIKASKLPAVKQLPPMILKGLTQAPVMIADMRSRQGMIRVRAVGDWSKAEDAEKNYKMLRAQAAADDITPELFLLATLSELKLFDKMKSPLEEMLTRQPNNDEIKALHALYSEKISKDGKP